VENAIARLHVRIEEAVAGLTDTQMIVIEPAPAETRALSPAGSRESGSQQ
jgi:hypothetical protein